MQSTIEEQKEYLQNEIDSNPICGDILESLNKMGSVLKEAHEYLSDGCGDCGDREVMQNIEKLVKVDKTWLEIWENY